MKLYNSLTKNKDEFVPLKPNEVSMYSCGPTVYDYFHIGNARPFIVFDCLRRYFEYKGFNVRFVQNFTDIDDKMINRAKSEGVTLQELAEKFIEEYFKDADAIGINRPTAAPRATHNIQAIIEMVEKLIDKGYAYEADGDVYFSVKKFEEYGKLSHQPLEELESGARVGPNENKREAMDFAVWKKAKASEPAWESPWGEGRPGWHIECSAMANRYLGATIDLHCGGQDLIFPHHENEIAQSEASNGCEFARYWLHNGYININNQKMSKSANNFFTVRDILSEYDADVVRFFLLSGHYRSPINFSEELMEQAEAGLSRLKNCVSNAEFLLEKAESGELDLDVVAVLNHEKERYLTALDDDFNTALGIGVLFDIAREVNKAVETASRETLKFALGLMRELADILGIFSGLEGEDALDAEVEALIQRREQARSEKNYALADEIRDELHGLGIVLEDTAAGVKWKRD